MPHILLAIALLFGCSGNTFTDERDNKTYRFTKIGEQTWMAENLNYEAEGSKCYDNNPDNCKIYGRLYNWQTALKVCPKGWHLPDNTEWKILVDFAGGEVAGKKLKATNGWNDDEGKSCNGEDKFGFAAIPGGFGSSYVGFNNIGSTGYWWSTTENFVNDPYIWSMYCGSRAGFHYNGKTALHSVRCVRD